MKVVITGGTGLIGRRRSARLLARGAITGPDGNPLLPSDMALSGPPLPRADDRLKVVTKDIADPVIQKVIVDWPLDRSIDEIAQAFIEDGPPALRVVAGAA